MISDIIYDYSQVSSQSIRLIIFAILFRDKPSTKLLDVKPHTKITKLKELASSELVLFNKVVQFILGASCSSASSQFLFANMLQSGDYQASQARCKKKQWYNVGSRSNPQFYIGIG